MLKFIAQNFLYDHDEMSVLQLKGIRVKYQKHIRICKHTPYIYISGIIVDTFSTNAIYCMIF